ncbi:Hypothetical predicted protein [Pelobates cultripes]|uniref:Uncharacterized protein n=1 Tax=Pelobates cultripes TaxID=61616 RepID=A0AAD1SC57_PELCU|nr:Hypothetical predicted protein [Pelobates cultripes]
MKRGDRGDLTDTKLGTFQVWITSPQPSAAYKRIRSRRDGRSPALTPANHSRHLCLLWTPFGGSPPLHPMPLGQYCRVVSKMAENTGSPTTEAYFAASQAWLNLILDRFWAKLAAQQLGTPKPDQHTAEPVKLQTCLHRPPNHPLSSCIQMDQWRPCKMQ